MMLNELTEAVALADHNADKTSASGRPGGSDPIDLNDHIAEFRLEFGLPVWSFKLDAITIEKRVVMPHGQNTAFVNYSLISGPESVRLVLRPCFNFRSHEDPVSAEPASTYALTVGDNRYEVSSGTDLPALRLMLYGQDVALTVDRVRKSVTYELEERRGYPSQGDLWSPGFFHVDLRRDGGAALVLSTQSWDDLGALSPAAALDCEAERKRRILAVAAKRFGKNPSELAQCDPTLVELIYAADQFLVTPAGRTSDAVRARAVGDEIRTVIAGYHWFTDWGRDTMISLEGLTLTTGRYSEGAWILRTFAQYIRDGLIPNLFPEGRREVSTIPLMRRCGSSTRCIATRRRAAIARSCRWYCRNSSISSSGICEGHCLVFASIPRMVCSLKGPMDMRSRGWMPRSGTGWSPRGGEKRLKSMLFGTTP